MFIVGLTCTKEHCSGHRDLRPDLARPSGEMTRYIEVHKDTYGVEPICQVPDAAPSTYYAGSRDRHRLVDVAMPN